jgi:hypothetical protein
MRFRSPELFLGVFLAVAIFSMGMMFESSRSSSTEQQSATNTAKENPTHPPERGFWNWITHDAAGFFTLWLVIVGGTQIGLFYWQLRLIRVAADDAKKAGIAAGRAATATESAVELTRQTAERQLRAYVVITSAEPSFDGAGDLTVTIKITNCGQTPAYNVTASRDIRILDFPNPQFSPIPETRTPRFTLAKDQPMEIAPVLRNVAGISDIGALFDAGRAVYIFGEVIYEDIFKKRRRMPFHMICTGRESGRLVVSPLDQGNGPDD